MLVAWHTQTRQQTGRFCWPAAVSAAQISTILSCAQKNVTHFFEELSKLLDILDNAGYSDQVNIQLTSSLQAAFARS